MAMTLPASAAAAAAGRRTLSAAAAAAASRSPSTGRSALVARTRRTIRGRNIISPSPSSSMAPFFLSSSSSVVSRRFGSGSSGGGGAGDVGSGSVSRSGTAAADGEEGGSRRTNKNGGRSREGRLGQTVFITAPPPFPSESAVSSSTSTVNFQPSQIQAAGGAGAGFGAGAGSSQSRSMSHSSDGRGGEGGSGIGVSGSGGSKEGGDDKTPIVEASWKGKGQTAVFASETSRRKKKKNKNQFLDPSVLEGALQQPAGVLVDDDEDAIDEDNDDGSTTPISPKKSKYFIPQVALHANELRDRRRVLVLCTGGTLTMAPDPSRGGALAPVEGAVTAYMREMRELHADNMPEVVAHEYSPFFDSSDMGPADWALIANDIKANYLHFDGFVVLMGTDTMAYAATALSFMLENLGKPVIFTGSQIPLSEPYNDARRNLIMALIFASRDTINEVSIFFHDRLIRACRATKVNTHRLLAFDSPNIDPLAKIGITIDENEHLVLPPARGALRVHANMDTRLLTLRLVPGFDDGVIKQLISAGSQEGTLRALVLQLYGTGNVPSVKEDFVQILSDAREKGILVVASTQCFTGSVMLGHYATGQALKSAGVVSGSDMTLEAIACKCAYLFGRGDLSNEEVANLMGVSLRGEVTPPEALSPPPLSSAYQRASRKGKKYY